MSSNSVLSREIKWFPSWCLTARTPSSPMPKTQTIAKVVLPTGGTFQCTRVQWTPKTWSFFCCPSRTRLQPGGFGFNLQCKIAVILQDLLRKGRGFFVTRPVLLLHKWPWCRFTVFRSSEASFTALCWPYWDTWLRDNRFWSSFPKFLVLP